MGHTFMMGAPASCFRKLWHLLLCLAVTTRIEQVSAYAVKGLCSFDRSGRRRIRVEQGDLIAPRPVWNRRNGKAALYSSVTTIGRSDSSFVNGTSFFTGTPDHVHHQTTVLEKPPPSTTTIQQQYAVSPTTNSAAAPHLSIIVNSGSGTKQKKNEKSNDDSRTVLARHLFSCLFCFSAGFGDVRAIRNFGGPVNMCTGGIVRAILAVMERRWEEVWTPTLLTTFYVLGAISSRLAQKAVEEFQRGKERRQQQQQHQQLERMWQQTTPSNERDHAGKKSSLKLSLPLGWRLPSLGSPSSNMSTLCWAVVPLILAVFGVATWKQQCIRTCVAAQAFGFGLIHTTAQEVTGGSVVFAVTGHVMAASRLAVDTASAPTPSPSATKALFQRISMIASFAMGVAVAAILWDNVLPLLSSTHHLEHITMGAWYALLFALCSRWV
jgi:uncharacterized membrane protein YoaK (UPF0700 family)